MRKLLPIILSVIAAGLLVFVAWVAASVLEYLAVTAMMAFFLLLWILNMVPPETKAGLAAYFSGERNFDSSSTSHVSNNPFIQNTDKINTQDNITINETQKSHIAIAKKLKEMIMADAIPQNASGINADDVGVQLRINSDAMFKPGSAEFSTEGL